VPAEHRRWSWRATARLGIAIALFVVLGARVGSAAFARGFDLLSVPLVLEAFALTALSTCCAALRWRVVARRLDVPLPAGRAVAAYYRSQLLNSVLPGGVIGDVHRAVVHGRDVDDIGRAARAVFWERAIGQVVQAIVTIAVLTIMPSPGRLLIPVLGAIVGGLLVATWRMRRVRRHGPGSMKHLTDVVGSDVRSLMGRPVLPVLAVTSVGIVVSHVALFVLVAHADDQAAPVHVLVPLAVIALIAAGIPLSVGGWGLREGAAAWAFAAAVGSASTGVAVSVTYGVVSLIAVTPGAALLGIDLLRRRRSELPDQLRSESTAPRGVLSHG